MAEPIIIVEMEISKRWANENPALAYSRLLNFIVGQSGRAISIKRESDGFITVEAVGSAGDAK